MRYVCLILQRHHFQLKHNIDIQTHKMVIADKFPLIACRGIIKKVSSIWPSTARTSRWRSGSERCTPEASSRPWKACGRGGRALAPSASSIPRRVQGPCLRVLSSRVIGRIQSVNGTRSRRHHHKPHKRHIRDSGENMGLRNPLALFNIPRFTPQEGRDEL